MRCSWVTWHVWNLRHRSWTHFVLVISARLSLCRVNGGSIRSRATAWSCCTPCWGSGPTRPSNSSLMSNSTLTLLTKSFSFHSSTSKSWINKYLTTILGKDLLQSRDNSSNNSNTLFLPQCNIFQACFKHDESHPIIFHNWSPCCTATLSFISSTSWTALKCKQNL